MTVKVVVGSRSQSAADLLRRQPSLKFTRIRKMVLRREKGVGGGGSEVKIGRLVFLFLFFVL